VLARAGASKSAIEGTQAFGSLVLQPWLCLPLRRLPSLRKCCWKAQYHRWGLEYTNVFDRALHLTSIVTIYSN